MSCFLCMALYSVSFRLFPISTLDKNNCLKCFQSVPHWSHVSIGIHVCLCLPPPKSTQSFFLPRTKHPQSVRSPCTVPPHKTRKVIFFQIQGNSSLILSNHTGFQKNAVAFVTRCYFYFWPRQNKVLLFLDQLDQAMFCQPCFHPQKTITLKKRNFENQKFSLHVFLKDILWQPCSFVIFCCLYSDQLFIKKWLGNPLIFCKKNMIFCPKN